MSDQEDDIPIENENLPYRRNVNKAKFQDILLSLNSLNIKNKVKKKKSKEKQKNAKSRGCCK